MNTHPNHFSVKGLIVEALKVNLLIIHEIKDSVKIAKNQQFIATTFGKLVDASLYSYIEW